MPGIAEAMRANALQITRRAMLSRAAAVIRKKTLIINLPGSPKAVRENLEFIISELDHALDTLGGVSGDCAVTLEPKSNAQTDGHTPAYEAAMSLHANLPRDLKI